MTADITSPNHPLRHAGGGFAHELDDQTFKVWLRKHTMTEHDYWVELGTSDDLTERFGKPMLTMALTTDQKGWAKQRFPIHYRTPGAKWYVREDKPSVPVPAIRMSRSRMKKKRSHH